MVLLVFKNVEEITVFHDVQNNSRETTGNVSKVLPTNELFGSISSNTIFDSKNVEIASAL